MRGDAGVAGSEIFGVPVMPGCKSGGETVAHIAAASTMAMTRPTKRIAPDVVGLSS